MNTKHPTNRTKYPKLRFKSFSLIFDPKLLPMRIPSTAKTRKDGHIREKRLVRVLRDSRYENKKTDCRIAQNLLFINFKNPARYLLLIRRYQTTYTPSATSTKPTDRAIRYLKSVVAGKATPAE